jgi:hypothetical protein
MTVSRLVSALVVAGVLAGCSGDAGTGSDPDDPVPSEGARVLVDGVASSADGRVWVGVCCEPSAGSLLFGNLAEPLSGDDFMTYGHAPFLAASERWLLTLSLGNSGAAIVMTDLTSGEQSVIEVGPDE